MYVDLVTFIFDLLTVQVLRRRHCSGNVST